MMNETTELIKNNAKRQRIERSRKQDENEKIIEVSLLASSNFPMIAALALKMNEDETIDLIKLLTGKSRLMTWEFYYSESPNDVIADYYDDNRRLASADFIMDYLSGKLNEKVLEKMTATFRDHRSSCDLKNIEDQEECLCRILNDRNFISDPFHLVVKKIFRISCRKREIMK